MAYDRRRGDEGDWEWLKLREGWAQYEVLERIAICLESGVPLREAKDLAYRQVGAGAWCVPTRPY